MLYTWIVKNFEFKKSRDWPLLQKSKEIAKGSILKCNNNLIPAFGLFQCAAGNVFVANMFARSVD